MTGLLGEIRRLNRLGDRPIAEPFAGGAGASLSLLYREETHEIYINDADPAIHDFWWTIVNRNPSFIKLLLKTRISIPEWYRQRSLYRNSGRASRLRRGFAAFYLNRCNRSGIITDGGPVGGVKQTGKWKLNARFNKTNLRERCEKVFEFRDRIRVSGKDGIEFIVQSDVASTLFFIDPPYFVKGQTLYQNTLNEEYHLSLADTLKERKDEAWVLTYDDCPKIRKFYQNWSSVRPFSLRYIAAERRIGKELLITPKWMHLPPHHSSAAISL